MLRGISGGSFDRDDGRDRQLTGGGGQVKTDAGGGMFLVPAIRYRGLVDGEGEALSLEREATHDAARVANYNGGRRGDLRGRPGDQLEGPRVVVGARPAGEAIDEPPLV